ncbi:hypothetical protein [Algoriphagus aquaeductus]|uniref:hypothetical protein n=1 Tax=Algoriphagus aquaeductus TaxID=475299 RepID=UPI0015EB7FE4|nr:hypothetical protein [Algoriphagus aquaeductus]
MIIVIGYYFCQWEWSIGLKYWTIALGTLGICLGIYFGMIRPMNWTRYLFGMKVKK